jgi:putative transposase
MKKTKFTEAQIVFALRQTDTGVTVAEVCRKMGVSEATGQTPSAECDCWQRR